MIPPRPTLLAQTILRTMLQAGDTVIDATAGRGHDTLFLAGCVGPSGRVLAFDVQDSAIRSARERLEAAGLAGHVIFHQTSHARLAEFAQPATVAAVMFNLGYLPGADHELTTQSLETVAALGAAAVVLQTGGALSVVCYPGHPQGASEAASVEARLTSLASDGWRVAKYGMLGTLQPAPFLLVARKP